MQEPSSINRRKFIKQSGLLMSAAMMPVSGFSMINQSKYKMGLQLFTIRDAMEKDPIGSLKIAKALGYEDLEIYGYNEEQGSYYGFKASEFKRILDDIGLTVSSGHYGFSDYFKKSEDELKRYVGQCIEGAQALDKSYITWPWLHPDYRTIENFKLLADKLNKIGEQVTNAGLGFAYHNHGFEFEDHDGQIGYDVILNGTDANLVKLQLDLYWVEHSSKLSPEKWITKQPERYVMWHIKDMDKITRDYTELGNGSIDYKTMLPDIDQTGLQFYYLEQGGNFAQNSIQSITDSATYFKMHLKKYL
ncbi:sugar phosphate isomerase/epimerase family protein [Allomuricauda sp. R78024]|uniref:sugar phosphate isomerase/epimerase family protein n=1 Tax=Allomuricauda sp. R78024 TaxID=3093867 RepID=UPI0037C8CF0A